MGWDWLALKNPPGAVEPGHLLFRYSKGPASPNEVEVTPVSLGGVQTFDRYKAVYNQILRPKY